MTKYVVSGYIGFDNFGDEAIARTLIQKLKKEGAENIILISSNPQKTKKIHNIESCAMLNFIPAIIKSDVLISGGGSLLQDVTSIKSLLYYLSVIYTALALGKKVDIFAQGIGPINSKIGRFFTKFALKNARNITVRDSKSQELLSEWGIKSTLVKDPILELDIPKWHQTGILGVQLRNYSGVNDEFLNKLAYSIKMKFENKKIKVISLQDKIDLEVCSKFCQILKNIGLESELIHNLNIDEAIEQISKCEYLIGMRFHANVIGIKAGVKTIAINYDPKVEKLAKEYNLPVINFDDTDFSKAFE